MKANGLTESKSIIQCQLMDNKLLVHKHLIVRAEVYRPPMDEEVLRRWLEEFISEIGMKVMMGPYVKYSDMVGNRGLTAVTIIETSHIALHVWDECEPAMAQLDVYTCSTLNIQDVFDAITEWDPAKVEYKYIDRENGLTLIEKNVI